MAEKQNINRERLVHPVNPLYDSECRVLILGTFPSPKSREGKFFYHHPNNRFWKVMAAITGYPMPLNVPDKKALMLDNHIALWDVIASCSVQGAADSSIRDVVPTNLEDVIAKSSIGKIFANGNTASRLYMKYHFPVTKIPVTGLPSTSPANARWNLESLILEWSQIMEWVQK